MDQQLKVALGTGLHVNLPPAGRSADHQLVETKGRTIMPPGDKSSYSDKQKRQATHIEQGYEKQGVGPKSAEARAWATVNKLTGGGKQIGSGRRKQ
jgi:hypothetical protein